MGGCHRACRIGSESYLWEISQDGIEFFVDGFLSELNLAHVEAPDAAYVISRMDNGRSFALSF